MGREEKQQHTQKQLTWTTNASIGDLQHFLADWVCFHVDRSILFEESLLTKKSEIHFSLNQLHLRQLVPLT
jgi:hypothetical protein